MADLQAGSPAPASFLQALAQCATTQASLRKSLADAHEREVQELSSRLQSYEAQLREEGLRHFHTPPPEIMDERPVVVEVKSAEAFPKAATEVIAVRPAPVTAVTAVTSVAWDADHDEVTVPVPPVQVKPASPIPRTDPPLLGVVPVADEDGASKTQDLPQCDASADSIPSQKRSPKQKRMTSESIVSDHDIDSHSSSSKSEEFLITKTDTNLNGTLTGTQALLAQARSPADKMFATSRSGNAWESVAPLSNRGTLANQLNTGMGPPALASGLVSGLATPRRVSWREGASPSPRGSMRGSINVGTNMRNSFISVNAMADNVDEDGVVQAWPVWHEVVEAIGRDQGVVTDLHEIEAKPKAKAKKLGLRSMTSRFHRLKSRDLHLRETTENCLLSALQAMSIHPSSTKRLVWYTIALLLIMYDVVMIPLAAFDLDIDDVLWVMAWTIAIFWLVNLVISFFMGYHEHFKVELRFRKTALHYVKTWLTLDLILVALDWGILIDGAAGGRRQNEARTLHAAKTVYIVRAMRVLRLARVVRLPSNFRETAFILTRSEYMRLTLGIIKHMLFILIINHVIACIWYLVGKHSGWVAFYMAELDQGSTWEMKYLTSLHWSLTQFTPATMTVQPRNLKERAFAVAVLLFALVSFSSFVSSITNLMNHLRSLKSAEAKQFSQLERYFHDNKISFGLSLRVRRYLEHYLNENKRRPQEKDVEMIAKLSEPLKMDIHYEVFSPSLVKHPFFCRYGEYNLQAMRKLCHTALRTLQLSTDDVLFNSGETAKAMYFVISGKLEYKPQGRMPTDVLPGEWICEMVLWRPWEHLGRVRSLTESKVIALDVAMFHQIVIENKSTNKVAEQDSCEYAFKATKVLSERDAKDLTDLDDSDVLAANDIARDAFHEARRSANHKGHHFNVFGMLHPQKVQRDRNSMSSNSARGSLPKNRDSSRTNSKSVGIFQNSDDSGGCSVTGSYQPENMLQTTSSVRDSKTSDRSGPITGQPSVEIVSPCRPAKPRAS